MDDLIPVPMVGVWWLVTLDCGHKQVWGTDRRQFVSLGSRYCNQCPAETITHHKYGPYPSRQSRAVAGFTAMEGDHVRQR
jgi:hypothetical protein